MKTVGAFPILSLALVVALSGCGYNTIQAADEDVKAAWAEVQNQYQRRMDLIPNLVKTVKGAAGFERETLEAVIQARAKATSIQMDASILDNPEAFQRFEQTQSQLGGALGRLLVAVERYPQLQATANFRDLQAQLEGTENRITVARRRYIESVSGYNKLIRQFPTNLTGRYILQAALRSTFEASTAAEVPPEVEF